MTKSLAKGKLMTALVHASTEVERLRREVEAQPWGAEAAQSMEKVVKRLEAMTLAVETGAADGLVVEGF